MMTDELTLKPRFVGKRFDDHSIPVELSADLKALQDLVIAVASVQYFRKNKERDRLPRGFKESLTLHMATIEAGSAMLELAPKRATNELFPAQSALRIHEAYSHIIAELHKASAQVDYVPDLPERAWPAFNRFGRSLRDDETIILGKCNDVEVLLTKELRHEILRARSDGQTITELFKLTARLSGIKGHDVYCEISGREFSVKLSAEQYVEIEAIQIGDLSKNWVLLTGLGAYDKQGELQKIEEVTMLELLDADNPRIRLEYLRALPPGWLNGEGDHINPKLLDQLGDWFDQYLSEEVMTPPIFPTPEGGVELEWSQQQFSITITFDLGADSAEWSSLDLNTDDEDSREYRLSDLDDMAELAERMVASLKSST